MNEASTRKGKVIAYVSIAILLIAIAAVVMYFSYSSSNSKSGASPTQANAVSDTEKYKILDKLSQGATSTMSTKKKLQLLSAVKKQKSTAVLIDSDKLKLLEPLR